MAGKRPTVQAAPSGCSHDHGVGEHAGCHHGEEEDLELQERKALGRIAHALRDYPTDALAEVARWDANFRRLPPRHAALLAHLPAKAAEARLAVDDNAAFVWDMLSIYREGSEGVPPHLAAANTAADEWVAAKGARVPPADADKVRYLFKNLMRDWSEEGASERASSYGRICSELAARLGPARADDPQAVLVPGCGLARLCCEVAALGYAAQGNEFNYYLLLASSFLLNHVDPGRRWPIHPWLHSNCNQQSDADQLRAVPVPDAHPGQLVTGPGLLSMCAGDFAEAYCGADAAGAFDAVVTCFFIDTAHNVVEYMEVIHNVLKEGGFWINLGPLLYHWADAHTYLSDAELSVELSLEDVKRAAGVVGFRVARDEMVDAPYMRDERSMLQSSYRCAFWTMIKDSSAATSERAVPASGAAADGAQARRVSAVARSMDRAALQ